MFYLLAVALLAQSFLTPVMPSEMAEAVAKYRAEQAREESYLLGSSVPSVGFQFAEGELRELVEAYFPARWHDWAMQVSWCESRWTTNAKNRRSSAAGLFQFLRSTWDWVADHTGTPDYDSGGVWEVHSQLTNAAWLVTNEGPGHWVCKG